MIKINSLELENVKRIKAIKIEPNENGLTIIGGNNNQGKTSVLDSIAWGLGGEKFKPTSAMREGSTIPPCLNIKLSNGLVVERKGKNSDLKVIDPTGNRAGQQLLNEFISQFALNVPKFMESSNKEKADVLLQIIGVGNKLYELEQQEQGLYNKRLWVGQAANQKKKYAAELTSYPDAPSELVSASELIKQQQDVLARNGENQRKRYSLQGMKDKYTSLNAEIMDLQAKLEHLQSEQTILIEDIKTAEKSVEQLIDESTAEIEKNIQEIDSINCRVRANLDKVKADDEAKQYSSQYDNLSKEIDSIRKQKYELLNSAELPLQGLSVENSELTYNGHKWDSMSSSEQLKVTTAIVRKLNPECGFVLLDKLEQMDINTLKEFGEWLESEGLQAIATRVSTGDECSIIIEDGYIKPKQTTNFDKWKAGKNNG